MNELDIIIRDRIQHAGTISVADYMDLALQHPDHGYYCKGDRLGPSGDFITAPEISQMFGEMIGLWCADVWKQLGSPKEFALAELGPGRGTLMHDALRATKKIKGFQDGMQIYMLESNDTFRASQSDKLAGFPLHHINSLNELPALPTLFIANEFFDALPIRQFIKHDDGWREQGVGLANDKLFFQLLPPLPDPPREGAGNLSVVLERMPDGGICELSMQSLLFMRDISARIARHHGAAIIIDYGYSDPPLRSTLQAVAGHQPVSVLQNAGQVDLTAHVDFAALRQSALGQQTNVSPIIGQGEFLNNLGIELRAMQLKQNASPKQIQDIDAALHRLTNNSEMGSLFKVMAVSSLSASSLPGF